jgi:hypothetical protein
LPPGGVQNGLAVEQLPEVGQHDTHGVFRNAKLLNEVFAYVAFWTAEGWVEDVEDLITRAKSDHRQVRVVEV